MIWFIIGTELTSYVRSHSSQKVKISHLKLHILHTCMLIWCFSRFTNNHLTSQLSIQFIQWSNSLVELTLGAGFFRNFMVSCFIHQTLISVPISRRQTHTQVCSTFARLSQPTYPFRYEQANNRPYLFLQSKSIMLLWIICRIIKTKISQLISRNYI